jgi:hypothetical protein
VRFLWLAALRALPVLGQVPYERPAGISGDDEPLIGAGYRALITCAAYFVDGRLLSEIKSVEPVDVDGIG